MFHESRRQGQNSIGNDADSERGLSLIEVTVALSLFLVLILSVFLTLMRGMEHRQQSLADYRAMSALRDMVADIQETANAPQDLTNALGIGAVFLKYNALTFPVSTLTSGQIAITCYPNEAAIPVELGGPQDLNFDGDPSDDLGNVSAGTDLKLVPMTLTLSYFNAPDNSTRTMTMYRLITKTTN
jgi:Tfp pilus assembly protein PilV